MPSDAALGITTRYASKYGLLDTAQLIMDGDNHRVCMCCSAPVPEENITINRDENGTSAAYGGLVKCGNVWACPVCAAKISEERRVELQAAVHEAKKRGWQVVMMTNTISHHAGQSLEDVKSLFRRSWRQFTSGRWRQDFYEGNGIQGSVRAWEVTHGKNGWHVHTHTLLFCDVPFIAEKMQEDAAERWAYCVEYQGGKASLQHGLTISQHEGELEAYVSKFGKLPEDIDDKLARDSQGWDEAAEVSKAVVKKSSKGGRTPWQLLADAGKGDGQAARLFREYVLAMKGQRQLVWSDGLRDTLLVDTEQDDQDIAEEVPNEELAVIELPTWREICYQHKRGELLDIALADADRLRVELAKLADDSDGAQPGVTIRSKIGEYKIQVRRTPRGWQSAAWHESSNRTRPNFKSKPKRSEMEAYFVACQFANYKSPTGMI